MGFRRNKLAIITYIQAQTSQFIASKRLDRNRNRRFNKLPLVRRRQLAAFSKHEVAVHDSVGPSVFRDSLSPEVRQVLGERHVFSVQAGITSPEYFKGSHPPAAITHILRIVQSQDLLELFSIGVQSVHMAIGHDPETIAE